MAADFERLLASLTLRRLGEDGQAGLCLTSLPMPRGFDPALALSGRPTYVKPLGQKWGETAPSPYRVLLLGDSGGAAPAELQVTRAQAAAPATSPPLASAVLLEKSPEPEFYWERHQLRLEWGGRSIRLAMGMRVGQEVRWWEACRLVSLAKGPICNEAHMAGSIPHLRVNAGEFRKNPGYRYPGLHVHQWLSGHIYLRLHANGVCEIIARHVNSKFVDDGLQLDDAVPVVGIWADEPGDLQDVPQGPWDGTLQNLAIGALRLNVSDVAPLATARQPGRFDREGDCLVWQPYLGMELFSGINAQERTGQPYILRAEQRAIPRGMARTLRFTLSFNPQRPPRVARYLAPAWWYGLCEEFTPKPFLPVVDRLDEALTASQRFLHQHMVQGGFEDGSLPRGVGNKLEGRNEPGWEGEAAGAALLLAYRTGEAADYDLALRACYCFNDVYVDHAAKIARPHGYFPNAINLPMSRMHACVYAYLETGDRFCLDAARAVIETCYWTHKNSWPRLAIGRDACFLRGAMLLYRCLNDEHFLDITRDMIADVAASQEPAGWFGDQGGGSGIHGWNGFFCKPWMGLMAVGGLLDFLDLFPDGSDEALSCVKRFADWLMAERFDHGEGKMGWSYQHLYAGQRQQRGLVDNTVVSILPGRNIWHMDYLARLMTFCSLRFGDPSYYEAWLQSFEAANPSLRGGDHSFAQSVQYLPWTQAITWNATLDGDNQLRVQPLAISPTAPRQGTVMTPAGKQTVSRDSAAPTPAGR